MSAPVYMALMDLETYHGQGSGKRAGKYLRYFCPMHGSDHQRSLALDPESGRFQCFACGSWGYLEEQRQEWVEKRRRNGEWKHRMKKDHSTLRQTASQSIPRREEPQARPELATLLHVLQHALPGSLGERYLAYRQIPLALAQAYGVGYAAPGKWPHINRWGKPIRQGRWGRLVFPHTDPAGNIVNLYGRAVGSNEKIPKAERHDHLPGAKGVFHAQALVGETVFLCEGVFDALSLLAAGYTGACAIFGVDGLRWEWVTAKCMVLCLDQDRAGEHWRALAWEGVLRGKEVYWLPVEVYGGQKDLNEIWMATGRIEIGEWQQSASTIAPHIS